MNTQAPWFYSSGLSESATSIVLAEEEARHAMAARRLGTGDAVCITNGRGLVACGVVENIGNRPPQVTVTLHEWQTLSRGPVVHLASALPKGDRQKTMLDMATQAGMGVFTPLRCERSVASSGKNAIERWQRVTIESSKQCRRAWLPELNTETPLEDFLRAVSPKTQIFLASPTGTSPIELSQKIMHEELVILVGPEGGFTGPELDRIRGRSSLEIRLAPTVLRTETAAVLGVGLLSQLQSRAG